MSCKILSSDKISDKEFLELMIKHHQVAVKMSQLILMNSKDDFILDYARKVIFNQSEEIILMERLIKSVPNIQNDKSCNCGNRLISAKLEELYPGIFSNAKCDDSHFEGFGNVPLQMRMNTDFELISSSIEHFADVKPKGKMDHNKKLTDEEYVNHMVAHHKSGVELAKLVLSTTKEPRLLLLAQTIILDQEKEMFQLNHLYNCVKYNWRKQ